MVGFSLLSIVCLFSEICGMPLRSQSLLLGCYRKDWSGHKGPLVTSRQALGLDSVAMGEDDAEYALLG